jgi:hypothetical protein
MVEDQGMEEITKIHWVVAEGKEIQETKTEMVIPKELEVKYCPLWKFEIYKAI